jgi:hypothetical protein
LPAHLERIVRHCIEKNPEDRFQTARDLAFDLETVSSAGAATNLITSLPVKKRRPAWMRPVAIAALCMAALVAAYFAGSGIQSGHQPKFQRITFRRGIIQAARFASGGSNVVYAAALEGGPIELYSTIPGSPESRSLGVPQSGLFSVSPAGEVTIAAGARFAGTFDMIGTLAQVPLLGGTPREIMENVGAADYSPVAKAFAVVPAPGLMQPTRLEYPAGKTLTPAKGNEWHSHLRISPGGDKVAFADHDYFGDDGTVSFVDRDGRKEVLSQRFLSLQGLAWAPSGDEIWFTGAAEGTGRALYSVTLLGKQSLLASAPGTLTLHDVGPEGQALVSSDEMRMAIEFAGEESGAVKDLSWLDWSTPTGLSSDGKTFVFTESAEGTRGVMTVFVRKTDGSPAIKLGEGNGGPLSPDEKWVLARKEGKSILLPVRAGAARVLEAGSLDVVTRQGWLPDSRRIVIFGHEKGKPARCFAQDIDGGKPEPVTPEGEAGALIFPNSPSLLTIINGVYHMHPLGGEPKALPVRADPEVTPVQVSDDGTWVYLLDRRGTANKVYRTELATGKSTLWKELQPVNPAGVRTVSNLFITPSGKNYLYRMVRSEGTLYLVAGLK